MKLHMFVGVLAAIAVATAALPSRSAAQSEPVKATIPTPQPSPIVAPIPTVSPGYGAPNAAPTSANIVGVTQQPFVGLGLSDAIGMALLRDPNVAVAASNVHVATYQIAAARGAYDTQFVIEPSVKHAINAPQNAFFSGPNFGQIVQNAQSVQAGVRGQFANGATYDANVSQSRVDDNTIINAFSPYYLASFNLSVQQPLLKGTFSETRRDIELSVVNQDATTAQTLTTVSSTIASVEETYWDLVAAWRNVAVQEEALRETTDQQRSNVRLARRGAAAPIDAVESSTQVAVFQDNLFAAFETVSALQNQLKSLILADPADPIWRANLVPTSPMLPLPTVPPLDAIVATAMQNRPELRETNDAQKQADINLAYARNQTRPQVDLALNYQGNGFAGNALPPFSFNPLVPGVPPPPYLVGGFGQSYTNIGKFPAYQAGVVISEPIGDHTAQANLAVAHEQVHIAAVQNAGTEERVLLEVRDALQSYQSALSRLYSARAAREAATQVLASENRKFRSGATTTFLVLQRQIELVQDQGREIVAQSALNKAIVELARVDGSILSQNHVTLDTLGTGALPPSHGGT